VKGQVIVERRAGGLAAAAQMQRTFRQADKVDNRQRRLVVKKPEQNIALGRGDFCIQSVFHGFFLGRKCGLSGTKKQRGQEQQRKQPGH